MTGPLAANDVVVVVGAGLAGWRLCEALRRGGFEGSLSLLGGEEQLPYDRPPLTKQIMSGKWTKEQTTLASVERLDELRVAGHFGVRATALDVAKRTVTLEDGREFAAQHVVVATGCSARRLPFSAAEDLCSVRTLDDAERLFARSADLSPGATVVIIGGGFIGAEIASSLKSRGLTPLVLEAQRWALQGVVGDDVAQWLSSLAASADIELRTGQAIRDVLRRDDGYTILMDDGTSLDAALVVLAVGAVAATSWLYGSGLTLDNGVVTNEFLDAAPGISAIGDVARFRWRHDPFVEELRVEHWQSANDHAQYLASVLLKGSHEVGPIDMVPYFWSDQYGKKIQMLGHPDPRDDVILVAGSIDEGRWLALYNRDSLITGAVALNQARGLMLSRELVATHAALDVAINQRPWVVPAAS